jgi:hypothetical protein
MTYRGVGQAERISAGSTGYQYDQTGLIAYTPSGASSPT